jgi:hypothetical protein
MTPLMVLAQMQPNGGDGAGGLLIGGGMFLIWAALTLGALALLIWALVDAIRNPNLSDAERIVWILVIIFVGCIGPILYLAIGRNKTPRGPTGGPTI